MKFTKTIGKHLFHVNFFKKDGEYTFSYEYYENDVKNELSRADFGNLMSNMFPEFKVAFDIVFNNQIDYNVEKILSMFGYNRYGGIQEANGTPFTIAKMFFQNVDYIERRAIELRYHVALDKRVEYVEDMIKDWEYVHGNLVTIAKRKYFGEG